MCSLVFQRLRAHWLKEDDVNSKFINASIKARGKCSHIIAFKVADDWVEVLKICSKTTGFFFFKLLRIC